MTEINYRPALSMIENQITVLRESFSRSILTSPSQVLRAWLCPSSKCPRKQFESNSSIRKLWGPVVVRLSGRALAAQARCPGFYSRRLPAFSLSSIFASKKTFNLSLFQREARVSKQQQQFVCSRNLCEWWELGTAYIHFRGIEFTFGQQTPGPNNYGTRLFYSTSHC